jgi:biopolymer transport protein ExbD
LDLTPLIDVVFQLLIFFLLTSAFINPGIIVQLPAAHSGESGKQVGLSVTLDASGRLYIGPREVSLERLGEELRREAGGNRDVNVAVWGDSGVPYGRFVHILDICRTSGLERVVLMVRPESRAP